MRHDAAPYPLVSSRSFHLLPSPAPLAAGLPRANLSCDAEHPEGTYSPPPLSVMQQARPTGLGEGAVLPPCPPLPRSLTCRLSFTSSFFASPASPRSTSPSGTPAPRATSGPPKPTPASGALLVGMAPPGLAPHAPPSLPHPFHSLTFSCPFSPALAPLLQAPGLQRLPVGHRRAHHPRWVGRAAPH